MKEKIDGIQFNYRNYFILNKYNQEDMTVYKVSNGSIFYIAIKESSVFLYDSKGTILDSNTTKSLKFLKKKENESNKKNSNKNVESTLQQ